MQHNGTLYRLFGLVAHMTKDPVQKPDPYSDWVILGSKHGHDKPSYPIDEELLAAARQAWPHALAHARRELSDKDVGADKTAGAPPPTGRPLPGPEAGRKGGKKGGDKKKPL